MDENHGPHRELTRLIVALIGSSLATVIWFVAFIRPNAITETKAELLVAGIGVVLVVIDIGILLVYLWRRKSTAAAPAKREVKVTDASMSMTAPSGGTNVQAKDSKVTVAGVVIDGSTIVTITIVFAVLVAVTVFGLMAPSIIAAIRGPSVSGTVPPTLVLPTPERSPIPSPQDTPGTTADTSTASPSLVAAAEPSPDAPATAQASAATSEAERALHGAQTEVAATKTALDHMVATSQAQTTVASAAALAATQTRAAEMEAARIAQAVEAILIVHERATETANSQAHATGTALALRQTSIAQTAAAQASLTPGATPAAPVVPTPEAESTPTSPPVVRTVTTPRMTATPTARPGTLYAAPDLLTPYDGADVATDDVILEWSHPADLAAQDRFLLAVRHADGIDWTVTNAKTWQAPDWMQNRQPADGFSWWVAVVRDADVGSYGVPPGQLVSANSAIWRFRWIPPGAGPGPITPATPTVLVTPRSMP